MVEPVADDMADDAEKPDLLEAREGVATGEHHVMTPAEVKARNRRNLAVALGVVGFILLVYFTTLLRITQNIDSNPDGPTISDLSPSVLLAFS
ncbi:MAG: hypothetical protein AAF986_07600 [Pseudomonadota bacterium]